MTESQRLYWFRFQPARFFELTAKLRLSPASQGAFITLLCLCWQDGSIPREPRELARLTGATEQDLSPILPQFTPLASDTTRLYSPYIEGEREDAIKVHNRKKEAANARWAKNNFKSQRPTRE